jgi:C1A family cysteine protease
MVKLLLNISFFIISVCFSHYHMLVKSEPTHSPTQIPTVLPTQSPTQTPTELLLYDNNSFIVNKFNNWIEKFNIKINCDNHLLHIFENWLTNDEFIEETNSNNLTYTVAHNAYSGFDSTEFSEFMGFRANREIFKLKQNKNYLLNTFNNTNLPESVDWREKGAVTNVKDQGQCGSCWSFSSTGSLEGAYAIKYGNLVSFSEQELVDCSNIRNGGTNLGCNGGEMQSTLDWIGSNGGLCTEQSYPYVSGTTLKAGTCQKTCSSVSGSAVKSTVAVPTNSDTAMMSALTQQPVSIAIEADQKAFQLYSSGIFSEKCGTNLDHGVLLVGYGSSVIEGEVVSDYYIMKNSWGSSWGENGYMRMGKGSQYNDGAGQCGLLMEGSYPNL